MPCMQAFKHVIVSCIKLYTNASYFVRTSSENCFNVFCQRANDSLFTNRVWYVWNFLLKTLQQDCKAFFFLLNVYLAARQPTLGGYYRRGSLTHPMLITASFSILTESHREPCNELGFLSPAKRLVGIEPGIFRWNCTASTH